MLNQTSHIQSRNHVIFKRIYKLRNFRIHITHSGKDCITVNTLPKAIFARPKYRT